MTITIEREPVIRNQQQPGWYWSDNEIVDLYARRIKANGVAVYTVLARKFSGPERGTISFSEIAELLGLSRRTVMRMIQLLCEVGLLAKQTRMREQAGGNDANEYLLCALEKTPRNGRVRSDSPAPRGVPHSHPAAPECTTVTPRGDTTAQAECHTVTPVERERSDSQSPRTLIYKPKENQIQNPGIVATGTNQEGPGAAAMEDRGDGNIKFQGNDGGLAIPVRSALPATAVGQPAPKKTLGYPLVLLKRECRRDYLHGKHPAYADLRYPQVTSAFCWAREAWGVALVEEALDEDAAAALVLEALETDLGAIREAALHSGRISFRRALDDYLAGDAELAAELRASPPLARLQAFTAAIHDIRGQMLDIPTPGELAAVRATLAERTTDAE